MHPADSDEHPAASCPRSARQVGDVVDGVLFLVSSPYITGEVLHIGAGQTAG